MENNKLGIEIINEINFPILMGSVVAYAIGVGLYSYLGRTVSWILFWFGISIVLLFIISAFFLNKHFSIIGKHSYINETNFTKRNFFLLSGLTTLSMGAMLTVWLLSQTSPSLVLFLLLGAYLFSNLVYALPPFSLKKAGYSAIVYAINIGVLSPLFGYYLQTNEIHPTLLLLTFPAIFLLMAVFLANKLESYYEDYKKGTKTIMTVLGWQKGMNLHNLFVLFTYFSYAVAALVGLPWRLSIVVFLSMPFAAVQFWEMTRIREGLKPRWKLLKVASVGSISALAYFILFFLWLG
jgi:1,4-dihydroxy-2-naphthoate octaprenyltransferase